MKNKEVATLTKHTDLLTTDGLKSLSRFFSDRFERLDKQEARLEKRVIGEMVLGLGAILTGAVLMQFDQWQVGTQLVVLGIATFGGAVPVDLMASGATLGLLRRSTNRRQSVVDNELIKRGAL